MFSLTFDEEPKAIAKSAAIIEYAFHLLPLNGYGSLRQLDLTERIEN